MRRPDSACRWSPCSALRPPLIRRRSRPRPRSHASTSPAAPASSANVRSGTSSACAILRRLRCMIWRAIRRAHPATDADVRLTMAKIRTPPIYTPPPDAALAFYQAFEAKDLDAMMAAWADDEEVICVHPGGTRLV